MCGAKMSPKKEMKKILQEIQSGTFVKKWVKEWREGAPNFRSKRLEMIEHPIEKIGMPLRELMRISERLQGGGTKQFLAEQNSRESQNERNPRSIRSKNKVKSQKLKVKS